MNCDLNGAWEPLAHRILDYASGQCPRTSRKLELNADLSRKSPKLFRRGMRSQSPRRSTMLLPESPSFWTVGGHILSNWHELGTLTCIRTPVHDFDQ
jgi:hypothetical protein